MPALLISVEAVHADNVIPHHYFTSEVALNQPELGSSDPNIRKVDNCIANDLDFGIRGGSLSVRKGSGPPLGVRVQV